MTIYGHEIILFDNDGNQQDVTRLAVLSEYREVGFVRKYTVEFDDRTFSTLDFKPEGFSVRFKTEDEIKREEQRQTQAIHQKHGVKK